MYCCGIGQHHALLRDTICRLTSEYNLHIDIIIIIIMVHSLYRHTGCVYRKPFERVATYISYLARIRDEQTAERGKALAIRSRGCHTHTEPMTVICERPLLIIFAHVITQCV